MNDRQKIIVSLTSFPQAIPYAIQSIQSVLDGSVLPDKIVLYLTASQFADCGIPSELETLAERNPIFEVRTYGEDIRSYTKLIPALIDFPDDIIVTIDDDILYHADMLRDLLRLHKRLPQAIVAHRVRRVVLNAPYKKWRKYRWYDFLFRRYIFDHHAMQTGVGGVLYPPHSLDEKMLDASFHGHGAHQRRRMVLGCSRVARHLCRTSPQRLSPAVRDRQAGKHIPEVGKPETG